MATAASPSEGLPFSWLIQAHDLAATANGTRHHHDRWNHSTPASTDLLPGVSHAFDVEAHFIASDLAHSGAGRKLGAAAIATALRTDPRDEPFTVA